MKMKPLMMKAIGHTSWLVAGVLMLTACAEGYDGDDAFLSSVQNQQLERIADGSIVLQPSADGGTWNISWPVVHGAGGYSVILYDNGDPENPTEIVNKVVDGCSTTAKREDDINYKLVVKVLGNTALGNTEPAESTDTTFTTYTQTFIAIPATDSNNQPTNLAQWFTENPVPDDSIGINLNYDLAAGAEYILDSDIDFGKHTVTLRSTSKNTHAKIKYASNASIQSYSPMTVKYLDFDCSLSSAPVFELSPAPADSLKGATGKGDYFNLQGNWTIQSCNFEGVNYQLLYDNDKKYCLETMMIDNCIVHLTLSPETNVSGNAVIYFKTGYANYTYVQNSTFYNTGEAAPRYFLQHGNNNRADRAGYEYNLVSYKNNTFYNLNASQWSNYSGFAGRTTSRWNSTANIFYECGSQVARRLLGGRDAKSYTGQAGYSMDYIVFNNNTYWLNGAQEDATGYDIGTCLDTDPAFVDPDAATPNFRPTGEAQVKRKTGDPRWYDMPATAAASDEPAAGGDEPANGGEPGAE